MSARAYTKDELFSGGGSSSARRSGRGPVLPGHEEKSSAREDPAGSSSSYEEKKDDAEEAGSSGYDGPLELEHVIGYTGASPGTMAGLPGTGGEMYVKAMGSIVVVGAISDPHAQKLLRAHDEPLTALTVSRTGTLVASGQRGSTRTPGYSAPVIIWDARQLEARFKLRGMTRGCRSLDFSPDERFLAGAGEDDLLYVWDAATGEVVFGKKYTKPLAILKWLGVEMRGRKRAYRIALGVEGVAEIEHGELTFDTTRQQWGLTTAQIQMPTAGMARLYHCATQLDLRDDDDKGLERFLCAGTSEGDLVVMRLSATVGTNDAQANFVVGGVYRASVPICSGGVTALAAELHHDVAAASSKEVVVFAGGGDGVVRRLRGYDMRWRLEQAVQLEGTITSLSLTSTDNGGPTNDATKELLVGTSAGRTYRLLAADLEEQVQLSVAHVGRPTCCAFGARADVFATAAADGSCVVWDLGDYQALAVSKKHHVPVGLTRKGGRADEAREFAATRAKARLPDFGGGARCLAWVTDVAVVVGYNDAAVRCYSAADGAVEWEIATAHRAGISAVAAWVEPKLAYLVTAADDGSIRVWNLSTREVMMQFAEHLKGVSALVVDVKNPRLFHSAGKDCAVFTHDLQTERRTVSHMMRDGAFTGLSQRLDSEQELVTCDANGRVLFWDCDVADPIQGATVDARRVESVAVSPSGKYLALCRDELITIFQIGDLKPIAEGWAHSATTRSAQWSPDERQLVTVADDFCICVWNWFT